MEFHSFIIICLGTWDSWIVSMMCYPFNIKMPLNYYLILDGTALPIAYKRGNKWGNYSFEYC